MEFVMLVLSSLPGHPAANHFTPQNQCLPLLCDYRPYQHTDYRNHSAGTSQRTKLTMIASCQVLSAKSGTTTFLVILPSQVGYQLSPLVIISCLILLKHALVI